MKRLVACLCLSTLFILTASSPASAGICQYCVNEFWTCLWGAQQRRTSCLANAETQEERDQCWEDYDDEVYWCEAEYRWCDILYCDA